MKILILDNYDSFTFNLYQLVGEVLIFYGVPGSVDVKRNDAISFSEITKAQYDRIIISPGPGDPTDHRYFGVCHQVILELGKITPVFGVCLGMQGIGAAFGGRVVAAPTPRHGKTSLITHAARGLFMGLPQNLEVMRYHSLMVEQASLPACLEITAQADDGGQKIIMALQHKEYPIVGVQFHPESFATEGGKNILENFLFKPYARTA